MYIVLRIFVGYMNFSNFNMAIDLLIFERRKEMLDFQLSLLSIYTPRYLTSFLFSNITLFTFYSKIGFPRLKLNNIEHVFFRLMMSLFADNQSMTFSDSDSNTCFS